MDGSNHTLKTGTRVWRQKNKNFNHNAFSNWKGMKHDIPQKSTLAPLHFLVYINNLSTREVMYVSHKIKACSRNHCYRGKAIYITYSLHFSVCVEYVWVCVALGIQHMQNACNIFYCHLCPVWFYSTFSTLLSHFLKKVTEHKMRFDFLYIFRLKDFQF
jgi:hypothetical protein